VFAGLRGHGRGLLATAAGQVPPNLPQTYPLPDYELADLSLTTLLEQNATLLRKNRWPKAGRDAYDLDTEQPLLVRDDSVINLR
jgi:hypothetical protein